MNLLDLSVIIVNWNTVDILRDCLRSVFEQTRDIAFEVIVIDNASSDGSVSMVRSEFPQVILIENQDNRGFAAANNQGMAIARGRYCLLLNSDTVVLDGAIQKTIAFADAHLEAAVVGCRVLNPDRSLQPTCFMFPSVLNLVLSMTYVYKLFPRNRFFGRENMTWWNRDTIRPVEAVTGCFMLVRREAISQVGMMDERFFMYAEETDWCYRFRKAGWVNLFYPGAQIIHLGGQSTKRVRPQMILQLRAGILQHIHKHQNRVCYCLSCVLLSIWFAVRVPVWAILGVVRFRDQRQCFEMAKTYCRGASRAIRGYSHLRCRNEF